MSTSNNLKSKSKYETTSKKIINLVVQAVATLFTMFVSIFAFILIPHYPLGFGLVVVTFWGFVTYALARSVVNQIREFSQQQDEGKFSNLTSLILVIVGLILIAGCVVIIETAFSIF